MSGGLSPAFVVFRRPYREVWSTFFKFMHASTGQVVKPAEAPVALIAISPLRTSCKSLSSSVFLRVAMVVTSPLCSSCCSAFLPLPSPVSKQREPPTAPFRTSLGLLGFDSRLQANLICEGSHPLSKGFLRQSALNDLSLDITAYGSLFFTCCRGVPSSAFDASQLVPRSTQPYRLQFCAPGRLIGHRSLYLCICSLSLYLSLSLSLSLSPYVA